MSEADKSVKQRKSIALTVVGKASREKCSLSLATVENEENDRGLN